MRISQTSLSYNLTAHFFDFMNIIPFTTVNDEMARAASSAGTSTPIDRAMPERWSIGKPYSANYYYDEITTDELPPDQVDLSDYWVVKVVEAGIGAKDRQARWPAVFTSKMLKSSYINKVYYCQRSIAWPLHGHTLSVPNPRDLARSLSVLSFETSPVSSSSLVPETSPVRFSSRDLPHRPTDSDSPSYQTSSDHRTLALLLSPFPCSDTPLPPSPSPPSTAVRRAKIANSTDVSLSPSRLPTLRGPSQPLFDAEEPDPIDDLIEAQLENATPLAVLSGLDHPLRDHKAWQIRARDATTMYVFDAHDEYSNAIRYDIRAQ